MSGLVNRYRIFRGKHTQSLCIARFSTGKACWQHASSVCWTPSSWASVFQQLDSWSHTCQSSWLTRVRFRNPIGEVPVNLEIWRSWSGLAVRIKLVALFQSMSTLLTVTHRDPRKSDFKPQITMCKRRTVSFAVSCKATRFTYRRMRLRTKSRPMLTSKVSATMVEQYAIFKTVNCYL